MNVPNLNYNLLKLSKEKLQGQNTSESRCFAMSLRKTKTLLQEHHIWTIYVYL